MQHIKNVEKANQADVISLKKTVLKLAEVKNIIEKVIPKNIQSEEFLLVKIHAHKGLIIEMKPNNPPKIPAEIALAKISL